MKTHRIAAALALLLAAASDLNAGMITGFATFTGAVDAVGGTNPDGVIIGDILTGRVEFEFSKWELWSSFADTPPTACLAWQCLVANDPEGAAFTITRLNLWTPLGYEDGGFMDWTTVEIGHGAVTGIGVGGGGGYLRWVEVNLGDAQGGLIGSQLWYVNNYAAPTEPWTELQGHITSFEVTLTPEPGSLWLAAIACAMFGVARQVSYRRASK